MSAASAPPADRRRRPLIFACAGCAVLFACVFAALVVDAGYWVIRTRVQAAAPAPDAATLQAEWAQLPAGSAAAGEQVFKGEAGCSACHSLEPGTTLVGPSLAGVAGRAADRKPDYTAELYLYESIAYPGAYTVESFQSGVMPPNFRERLSGQQLADLIAFLMTR